MMGMKERTGDYVGESTVVVECEEKGEIEA